MSYKKRVLWAMVVLTFLLFAQTLLAGSYTKGVPGDCNGSGDVDIDDVVAAIMWIYQYAADIEWDCDCDERLGINLGDVFYLIDYIFVGGPPPLPPDVRNPPYDAPGPDEMFRLTGIDPTTCQMEISVKTPVGYDIQAVTLPFSYLYMITWIPAPLDARVGNIQFHPPYDHGMLVFTDYDAGKYFAIHNDFTQIPPPPDPVIPSTNGVYNLLCTVTFESDIYPCGGPKDGTQDNHRVKLIPYVDDRLSPLALVTNAKGENELILPDFRTFVYGTQGDPNCSGGEDIDDVVYLISYIFGGGPEPCGLEEWISQNGW